MEAGLAQFLNLGLGGAGILAVIIIVTKFLRYIENKNGHLERISENFANTIRDIGETIKESSEQQIKSNDELKMELRSLRQMHEQFSKR